MHVVVPRDPKEQMLNGTVGSDNMNGLLGHRGMSPISKGWATVSSKVVG